MKRYKVVQYFLLFSIVCLFLTNAYSVELSNGLATQDTSNCHATYFPAEGKLLIPCIDVVDATGNVQAYGVVLEQLATADTQQFMVKEWFANPQDLTTPEESNCHATYLLESGKLLMPCVDVVDSSGQVESHEVVMRQVDSTLVELPKLEVLEVDGVEVGEFRTRSTNGSVRSSTTLPIGVPTALGNVLTSAIWSNPTINVCWENPTSANTYYRDIVKNAVESTWDKVSGVDFVGWDKCLTNSKGIRVVWKDDPGDNWPHTKGLGKQLDGKPNGMLLNHEFNNWVGGRGCRNTKDYCVRVIGVHEFGHALGFAHEQARRDTPTWCTDKQQGGETGGDVYIGAWDTDSVMNYCNPNYNNNGNLSQTDILTVQTYYGQAPGSTLPNKPINVSAIALSSSSIKITWSDNSNNETGFYIYRWSGASWTKIGSVGANVTSYTNSGLQAGTTYYYYIASYNGVSENLSEKYASAKTQQIPTAGGTALSITVSGQLNKITIRQTSGAGDSGNYSVSGMYQDKTFYLSAGKKATVSLSGQLNKLYISSSIFGNVTYSSSGQLNNVIKIQ